MLYELAMCETVAIRTPVLVKAGSPEEAKVKSSDKEELVWVDEERELVNFFDSELDPHVEPKDVTADAARRRVYDEGWNPAGGVAKPDRRCEDMLRRFVERFREDAENDEPIDGGDAVDFMMRFWGGADTLLDHIDLERAAT